MKCNCDNPEPGCCPANAKEASDKDVSELAAKSQYEATERMRKKLEEKEN